MRAMSAFPSLTEGVLHLCCFRRKASLAHESSLLLGEREQAPLWKVSVLAHTRPLRRGPILIQYFHRMTVPWKSQGLK